MTGEALELRPLRDEEYDDFSAQTTASYAQEISELGDTPLDVARRRAHESMREILPDGLATPGHWISVLELDGQRVGLLWLATRTIDERQVMFIYDVEIDEAYRGRGLGRKAMLLAERETLAQGLHRIELNVFGGNAVARKLYLSLGYVERAVHMAKDLD
ncbi:MAG TPA: GNAT family N-acetyltransferase [Candidatus Limnocylindrales bacterium]